MRRIYDCLRTDTTRSPIIDDPATPRWPLSVYFHWAAATARAYLRFHSARRKLYGVKLLFGSLEDSGPEVICHHLVQQKASRAFDISLTEDMAPTQPIASKHLP